MGVHSTAVQYLMHGGNFTGLEIGRLNFTFVNWMKHLAVGPSFLGPDEL